MDRPVTHNRCLEHRNRGFSLVEVLVALAVLAIVLVAIFKLQNQTITMSAKARFLTIAPHLAQAKLAEIEVQDIKEVADGSGSFGANHPEYNWVVSVEEVPTELITDNNYKLIRINIDITQADENSYQLRTYRFYAN